MTQDQGQAVVKTNGLYYRGDEGTYSVYEYFKGGRALFEAVVNNDDPELKIYVGKVNATWAKVNEIDPTIANYGDLFETKGRAYLRTDEQNKSRVSSNSMRSYVRRRAFSIFANLYATKPAVVTDAEAMDELDD